MKAFTTLEHLVIISIIVGSIHQCETQKLRTSGSIILGYYGQYWWWNSVELFLWKIEFSDKPAGKNTLVIHRKIYYLTLVLNTIWYDAYLFCKASLMELLTFESQDELDKFMEIVTEKKESFQMCAGTFIGAVGTPSASGPTKWTWLSTGDPVKLNFKWKNNSPPTSELYNCLQITYDASETYVDAIDCNSESFSCIFVCTDTKIVTPNMTMTSINPDIFNRAKSTKLTTRSTTIKSG